MKESLMLVKESNGMALSIDLTNNVVGVAYEEGKEEEAQEITDFIYKEEGVAI